MVRKRLLIVFIITCSLFTHSFIFAQSVEVDNGLSWLSSNQNADGSWGGTTASLNSPYHSTSEANNSIYLIDKSLPSYSLGLQWLTNQTVSQTDFISRKIIALSQNEMDYSEDMSILLSYQNANGGWGDESGYENNILDTSLALQTLDEINYSDEEIVSYALAYLMSNQNSDGGWAFVQDDDASASSAQSSNVYMTALVLKVLSLYNGTFDVQTEIDDATAYLLTKQNVDGGFPSTPSTGSGSEGSGLDPSTVYSTALAFEALEASGADPSTSSGQALLDAADYLITNQLPNGSWNDDPYSTALALRILANIKPNLSISSDDISFSDPTPTVGDTISITADINNTGLADAPSTGSGSVSVHFYEGDPLSGGVLIAETTITSIPAFGSAQASVNWTIQTSGTQAVYVVADPLDSIEESDESDNTALKSITAATLPDLSITSADIVFDPLEPIPGETVTITLTVRNTGETTAGNVTIDMYDGDPLSGGINVGSVTAPSVGAGSFVDVAMTGSFAEGNHDIYVVVDEADLVTEGDETNNRAANNLYVGTEGEIIDLLITSPDITFNPAYPTEGEPVDINAVIHNRGGLEAGSVLVRAYLGDPETGGVQIGSDITVSTVPARASVPVSVSWDSTGHAGNNQIYVEIDPLDAITEAVESNNKDFNTVKVAAITGPDLRITSADISYAPLDPVSGDIVTITASVENMGSDNASNALVEFSLGEPDIGGTLIFNSQTIPLVAPGETVSVQATWDTTGFAGDYDIYVNIDPGHEIVEMNETNNTAFQPITITVPQGPDLTISGIDTTNVSTDSQSLMISGLLNVTIENNGNLDTSSSFVITVFEDTNDNNTLDEEIDNILGKTAYSSGLLAGTADTVNIALSGSVLFKDNLIHAVVDSSGLIEELDETNNMRHTGQECEYIPPVGTFDPVEKWRWTESDVLPEFRQAIGSVAVAPLIDTDDNGVINSEDIPVVVFNAHKSTCGTGCEAVIVAIRGDTGEEIFTVTDRNYRTASSTTPAAADIDNDGYNEIINRRIDGGIAAFEHDGTPKWISSTKMKSRIRGVSIADLDGDGTPEIIAANYVLNNDGTTRWAGNRGKGGRNPAPFSLTSAYLSLVADVDLDGYPEVVAGNTIYKYDGTIYWENTNVSDGFNAVANFDDDPYAEIVLITGGKVYLLSHSGAIIWGPKYIPNGGWGGPPTIADLDGDGRPEIGVAGSSRYVVFDTDGSILWQSITQDASSGMTGSSVFDFDGDGHFEVVYSDEKYMRVYDGATGAVLFETPNSSATGVEYPVIVDVDNDNRAEIIFPANDWYVSGFRGIRVFEDANDNWVNTRKIWNQHTYHITNVNDDGTIPQYEENNWEKYNNYRCNSLLPEEVTRSSDITASYITVDQSSYPASVTVSARIGNGGAVSHPAGVEVNFYDGDPLQGGVLIGSTSTSVALDKGEYEDVSFVWNTPAEGAHDIYVVADEENQFNECREDDNNTASALFNIQGGAEPPADMPDLEISPSDITVVPADIIEGQPANISAVVHNTGTLPASDVVVAFYDGAPDSGVFIGTGTILSVEAGADASLQVEWNTLGQRGINYIHVVIDPDDLISESNENNNASLVQIDVIAPTLPDLTISSGDITFSDQTPKEGDLLLITATIHNLGTDAPSAGSGPITVELYDGDPASGGILLDAYTISQIIALGEQADAMFDIDTIGLSGNHSFHVVIDPDNTINEQNEGNNSASADLLINSAGLVLTETTDKTQYIENEDVLITVDLTDLQNETRDLLVGANIYDSEGVPVGSVTAQPVTLTALGTASLTLTWNTGNTLIGTYSVTATAYDLNSNPLARDSDPISIVSSDGIMAALVLDKISYDPNEQATIISTVTNNSANEIFYDLTATVTINDPSNQELFTQDTSIGFLAPSSRYSFNTYWNTSTYPAGDYPVTFEVKDETGAVLSTSTKALTINSTTDPTKLLMGQISVDNQSLLQGDMANINYSVTNTGNVDLSEVDLFIPVVHVVELTPYDTLTDQTGLLMAETYTNAQPLDTQTYSAKDYLVILRASIEGNEQTLASTYFRVEGSPSAPSLNQPAEAEDVETLTPELVVNNASDPNDDDLTYEFELYSDSGLTDLLASSEMLAEGENTTAWLVPSELTENQTYYWRSRAYDGLLYGNWMAPASFRVNVFNDPPTAPTLSSPADGSEVSTYTPVLVVNNASDPDSGSLTYNFELALDAEFTQITTSEIGIFEGIGTTSWQVPVSLSENTYYYWRAQADDWLTEGPWMDTAGFFVNTANDAPTAPVIIAPADGSEITTLYADITASNSTDPENDPLTYTFEIDTAVTFDSPDLRQSGSISEGMGTTSWYADGLNDNTYYYVRAKADDGLAESPWSDVTGFFVNTVNDAPGIPILSNPSDGGAVNVFTPDLAVHNSYDVDGDVLTYEFEIYEDESMTMLVASTAGIAEAADITSWTVPVALVENNTYYWQARAFDGELHSGWMPVASFMVNTANDAPGAPLLQSPADGSTVDTLYPELSIYNAQDPDSDILTYDFEIYSSGILAQSITSIPENASGVTSMTLSQALSDDTVYNWRARAYDGDRYGAWMDMAEFSVHLPVTNITATIDFDPNTLNRTSKGKWVVVYIELPDGYNAADIDVSTVILGETIPAEPWPYNVGDHDKDGIPDLMVKFRRAEVIDLLPNGENVKVEVTGETPDVTFEGVDIIRVIN